MSKKVANNNGEFFITRKIKELLNLGESGKIDSFLARATKTLNNEIKGLNKNLDILKFKHEQELDSINDKLEDAEAALEAEYLNIPVEAVETNALQAGYVDMYIDGLDRKTLEVKTIKRSIKEAKENYTKEVEDINDQIESLTARISNISKR